MSKLDVGKMLSRSDVAGLCRALGSKHEGVRIDAAKALAALAHPSTKEPLARLILQDSFEVAKESIAALLRIGAFDELLGSLRERVENRAGKPLEEQTGDINLLLYAIDLMREKAGSDTVCSLIAFLAAWFDDYERGEPERDFILVAGRPPTQVDDFRFYSRESVVTVYDIQAVTGSYHSEVVEQAIDIVALTPTDEIVEMLMGMLQGRNPSNRFARRASLQMLPSLATHSTSKAADLLLHLMAQAGENLLSLPAIDTLAGDLLGDQKGFLETELGCSVLRDCLARENGVIGIAGIGVSRPQTICASLRRPLADADPSIRSNAVRCIARIGRLAKKHDLLPVLEKLRLEDPDDLVRSAADNAIRELRERKDRKPKTPAESLLDELFGGEEG